MVASTSLLSKATVFSFPILLYSVQTSVVIVNPGGTGTPIRFISAKLAPFPPNKFFIVVSPSAFLLPKKYTFFVVVILFYNLSVQMYKNWKLE